MKFMLRGGIVQQCAQTFRKAFLKEAAGIRPKIKIAPVS
jgi:hypothetical protein